MTAPGTVFSISTVEIRRLFDGLLVNNDSLTHSVNTMYHRFSFRVIVLELQCNCYQREWVVQCFELLLLPFIDIPVSWSQWHNDKIRFTNVCLESRMYRDSDGGSVSTLLFGPPGNSDKTKISSWKYTGYNYNPTVAWTGSEFAVSYATSARAGFTPLSSSGALVYATPDQFTTIFIASVTSFQKDS